MNSILFRLAYCDFLLIVFIEMPLLTLVNICTGFNVICFSSLRLFILHGPVKLVAGTRTNPLPMALCPPVLEPPPPIPPQISLSSPLSVFLLRRANASMTLSVVFGL